MKSDNNRLKVGIYVPTYNKGRYIKQTLESILGQTYKDFTLTVIDNASTDDTEDIVMGIKDERMRYIKNPTNIGSINNINKCIKIATEDYVAIYHSDDIYDSSILEKEIAFLEGNSDVKAVFTDKKVIDENNNITCDISNDFIRNIRAFGYQELIEEILSNGTPLVCPTFVCERSIFNEVGEFDTSYKYAGDTEMYLRISKKCKIGVINEQLINYRMYIGQESSKYERWPHMQEEFILLNKEIKYFESEYKQRIRNSVEKKYNIRLSKEYFRIARAIILFSESTDENIRVIKSSINNSYKLKLFPINTQIGINQRLIKYGMYKLVRILHYIKHIKDNAK